MSARKKRRNRKENESLTLKDSLDPEVLQQLKDAEKELQKQEAKEKEKETERQKKERARREKNKSFEQLLEENPMNWKDFK